MDEVEALQRPIGWWLKEADARIDEAFDHALGATGLDRRRWQVLAALSPDAASRADLAAALRRFDARADVDAVVADLVDRGLVADDGGAQHALTAEGVAAQQQAAEQVAVVRQRVAESLGDEGYIRLVGLLAQLVEGLEQPG